METGSYRTASTTTQSLTTRDFPRVFGIVRFIGLYSIPVARAQSLWRGELRDVGENPAKVSGYKILFPGQFSRLRGD